MRLVHSFCVEGYQKSQQILMVPCMFIMLRVYGLLWSCLMRVGASVIWCACCSVPLRAKNCQKESQAYCSLGKGQMKADIASAVSLLAQQPRALQKYARLLVTMPKRIVGQHHAVGTCCAMLNTLNTQTSHAQRFKQQMCSLWSSILMSKSLPVVTLV